MGNKIKSFARFIMFLGVVACLVAAACTLIPCYERNLGFARMNDDIRASIQTAIGYGIYALCFIFAGMPVYWLGCLFDRVEKLDGKLETIIMGQREEHTKKEDANK